MKRKLMKTTTKLFNFLLVLCILLGTAFVPTSFAESDTVIAYAVEGGNIYFDVSSGTITDADPEITAADIPAQIAGVDVSAIGQSAFEDCTRLTRVTTPETLTLIDWFAFRHCTSLSSITISAGVTEIGSSVFTDCTSLAGIWVDEANAVYSSDSYGALFNKEKTTLMICPATFSGTYSVPNTVRMVEYSAFCYCTKLIQVIIPESVISIDIRTFDDCSSLTGIWVDEANAHYSSDSSGVLFNKDKSVLARFPVGQGGVYTVPNTVSSIGECALVKCEKLTGIVLPESLNRIEHNAFQNCTSLKNITIPDSVTYIGSYAFANCESLTEIKIPANTAEIDSHAFNNCSALTGIWVDGANQAYSNDENGVLFDKEKRTLILCPATYNGSYTVPDGVTDIADGAFEYLHELTSVIFPETLRTIGRFSFYECPNLTSMYFLGDAPEVGYYGIATDSKLTIYFVEGKAGWTTPNWTPVDGYWSYPTETWNPDSQPEIPVFTDVPANEWYRDSVDYVVKNGLMNGMSATTFEPNTTMNRAMLVTVLWRYASSPIEGENIFTDVPNGQWYTEAVAWAAHNGIVGGIGNNQFAPNGNITREQLATILYRYCNSIGIDTSNEALLSSYPDCDKISSYAIRPLAWAVGAGLINGIELNGRVHLQPQGNATRAQVATILMRFIENVVE